MAVELKRRRFTIDEYQRMGEASILDADERVELLAPLAFPDLALTVADIVG